MSLHLVIGNMNWSRRRVMSALAGAATTLTSLSSLSRAAQAEAAAAWREYRNADLGFRVELPGEPKVEEQPGDASDPWIRTVEAQVEVNDVLLGAHCTENRAAIKADEQQKLQREGMVAGGMPVTREEARTVSGVAGRDFIREADDVNYIYRMVVVGNRMIAVSAFGDRGIHKNPTVRRFLDSLTLLQGGK
jgi:hypothetical protein